MCFARMCHLGWVGVDGTNVVQSVRSLQHNLLHVGADDGHLLALGVLVDERQELGNVTHQLLADALARAVDGQLKGRR